MRHWERVALVDDESLVYWLRKLVFRGAWLDHRVKENLLEVAWDDETGDFGYRDPTAAARCSSSRPCRPGTSSSSGAEKRKGRLRRRPLPFLASRRLALALELRSP